MIEHGARRLALVSDQLPGPGENGGHGFDPSLGAELNRLRREAATVSLVDARVGGRYEPGKALDLLCRDCPEVGLGCIVYRPTAMRPTPLVDLTADTLRETLTSVVSEAWSLHRLTTADGRQPDQLVLFASAAALLGLPGHGVAALTGAFLEDLALLRRTTGLPALCISWSPISLGPQEDAPSGSHRPSSRSDHDDHLTSHGIQPLSSDRAAQHMGRLLEHPAAQVGVIPIDLETWFRSDPRRSGQPLLSHLYSEHSARTELELAGRASDLSPAALLATPAESRMQLLEGFLVDRVARLMGFPPSRVSRDIPLTELGLDSLVVIKLQHAMERDLGLEIPVTSFFKPVSIIDVAGLLVAALEDQSPAEP
jgi:acyl carrier protein